MNQKRASLVTIFFIMAFISGFFVIVVFNLFWSNAVKHSYKNYGSIIRQDYLNRKKQEIKQSVLKVIHSIEYRRVDGEYKINGIVQSSLDNLISVANKIYFQNQNRIEDEKLKKILKQLFLKSRFYFNKGFYLFVNNKGYIVGSSKIKFDKRTRERFEYFFSNFTDGFFDGKTDKGAAFKSYVKFFKPLKLFILAFMYSKTLEHSIKEEVIFSVESKNSAVNKNNYIFINTKDGDSIITDNKIFNNNTKLWDTYGGKDKKRIKAVFKKELEAYNKPGGGFIYYKWYEPLTGKLSDKISFIYGYKPWGWIVGEGFYVDRTAATINSIKEQFYSVIKQTLIKSYIFFSLVVIFSMLIIYAAYVISRNHIKHILNRFEYYFEHRLKMKKDKCKVEEFCRIIDYINETIDTYNRYENEFLEAFSYAMEARDTYTKGHSHRVARYSSIIAKSLGLSEDKQDELYKAGLLHDVGKIGVPDNILLKPGKLTPNEYRIVKYHSLFSYEIVYRVSQFKSMANYVRHHHERCDGSGYPDGLECDKIELEAKILSIADVFDALTSRRTYRSKLSPKEAVEVLKKEKLDQNIIKKVEYALIDNYISETDTETRLQLTKEIDEIRKELFNIDYMTGLKRRRNFVADVEKLIKKKTPFVLFMVDIKALSFINYEFSTKAGDKVIIYTAVALAEVLEEMGYKNNNLSRAYNDAFLFTVLLKEEEMAKIINITDKIRKSLIDKVRAMIVENDKGRFVNVRNESLEHFIDFHILYCVYPYEADDVEKMIYVCVSKKTLSLIKLNNIDNITKK